MVRTSEVGVRLKQPARGMREGLDRAPEDRSLAGERESSPRVLRERRAQGPWTGIAKKPSDPTRPQDLNPMALWNSASDAPPDLERIARDVKSALVDLRNSVDSGAEDTTKNIQAFLAELRRPHRRAARDGSRGGSPAHRTAREGGGDRRPDRPPDRRTRLVAHPLRARHARIQVASCTGSRRAGRPSSGRRDGSPATST